MLCFLCWDKEPASSRLGESSHVHTQKSSTQYNILCYSAAQRETNNSKRSPAQRVAKPSIAWQKPTGQYIVPQKILSFSDMHTCKMNVTNGMQCTGMDVRPINTGRTVGWLVHIQVAKREQVPFRIQTMISYEEHSPANV